VISKVHANLKPLADHRGTYHFTAVVAGDGATPQTAKICVDYVDYTDDCGILAPAPKTRIAERAYCNRLQYFYFKLNPRN
jgi:hypothetical protein